LTAPRNIGRAHPAAQPVSDGNHFVGYLIERPSGQFEAAPPRGSSLGFYNSPQAAVHALLLARRDG